MFAAFQKASKSSKDTVATGWNWYPVPVSRPSSISISNCSADTGMNGVENGRSTGENHPKTTIRRAAESPEWYEIGLSSDDDEQFSPHGILQFRKMSAGSDTINSEEDPVPCSSTDMVSLLQHQMLQSAFPLVTTIQAAENTKTTKHESESKSMMATTSGLEDKENIVTPSTAQPCVFRNTLNCNKAAQDAPGTSAFAEQCKTIEDPTETTQRSMMSSFSRGSQASEREASKIAMMSDQQHRSQLSLGTQTVQQDDAFVSSKLALQRQLADALQALDLTRQQANGLRERVRTYTTNMKQQADDLRSSSRSLSHALDKVKEYRDKWKEELKLKEDARRKADELDCNVKSLQNVMAERNAELKTLSRGADALNRLLGLEVDCCSVNEKLTVAFQKVRNLLDLVEKVQADAALAAVVSTVELKESLRKFEEEKTSWLAYAKTSDEVFSGKVASLEVENRALKLEADALKQTSDEARAMWQRGMSENERKDHQLKQHMDSIKSLESTLASTQNNLEASISDLADEIEQKEALRQSFQNENLELMKEKQKIEETLAQLEKRLTEKKLAVREHGVNCVLTGDDSSNNETAISFSSQLRSSSYAAEVQTCQGEMEMQSLQNQIDELKRMVEHSKQDFANSERNYLRLRGDFRQLNWTAHRQQVIIQKVRTENRSLRISISNLKYPSEDPHQYHEHGWWRQNPSPHESHDAASCALIQRQRRPSLSGSSTDSSDKRAKLQTIHESSDEDPASSSCEVSSTRSEVAYTVASEPIPSGATASGCTSQVKNGTVEVVMDDFHQTDCQRMEKSLSASSAFADDFQFAAKRKRSRKAKRSSKTKLPIWRQENPDNQFSTEKSRQTARAGSDRGSGDVFMSSNSSSASEQHEVMPNDVAPQQPRRLVGIPMSETDFERAVGSLAHNHITPMSRLRARRSMRGSCDVTQNNDDGYASSVLELNDASTFRNSSNNCQQRSIVLLPRDSTSSDDISSASGIPASRHVGGDHKCLVTYCGATFDAASFGLTEMRQFTWEAGIAESGKEMNKFMDFLAKKADQLEEDPNWKGRHSLGISTDWLSLKEFLCE